MESNISFKKSFFGFDREGVMNYIAEITDEFQKYKKETVLKVEEMKSKLSSLEKAYNDILEENEKLKQEISKTDAETEEEKVDIRALVGSLSESMNVLLSFISSEEIESESPLCENEGELQCESDSEKHESDTLPQTEEDNATKQDIDDIINKYI